MLSFDTPVYNFEVSFMQCMRKQWIPSPFLRFFEWAWKRVPSIVYRLALNSTKVETLATEDICDEKNLVRIEETT